MSAAVDPPAALRVLLVCAGGMSSSLIENHIRQAAAEAGLALVLRSISVFEAEQLEFDRSLAVDVILVAPQIRFLRRSLERRATPAGVRVLPIAPMDFGMADGPAIVNMLQSHLSWPGPGGRTG